MLDFSRFRAIIVDSSLLVRRFIKKALTLLGFLPENILEAGDVEEALKLLDSPVDIAFVDVIARGGDGFEVVRKLEDRGAKVVVVTVDGSSLAFEKAMKMGVFFFIRKPFLPEEIKKVVEDAFGSG